MLKYSIISLVSYLVAVPCIDGEPCVLSNKTFLELSSITPASLNICTEISMYDLYELSTYFLTSGSIIFMIQIDPEHCSKACFVHDSCMAYSAMDSCLVSVSENVTDGVAIDEDAFHSMDIFVVKESFENYINGKFDSYMINI